MILSTKPGGLNAATFSFGKCNICGGESFSIMGCRSDGLSVLRCDTCSLGVVEAIPTQLGAYYDDAYYGADKTDDAVGYGDYQFTAEHGVAWAAALVQLLKPGGRILDIGCADGTLLAKLPGSFERFGIEVNAVMAARARKAGVSILGQDLLDPSIAREHRASFDVVTSIAVFEHLADLREGVKVSLELLKPDGVLLFEVPYISAKHENRTWFESSLEHVFYPSGEALRWLVEDLGACLVGGEVNVRDFASTYIGVAFYDHKMVGDLQHLFGALTSTNGTVLSKDQHRVRQQLMLVHAAESTPALLQDLGSIPTNTLMPPLMQRFGQLWTNDLRRLAAAKREGRMSHANFIRAMKGAELRIRQLKDRSNDLMQQLSDARVALSDARSETEVSRAQLHRLMDSSAWKMTYPLRSMRSRAPRMARLLQQTMKLLWWSIRLELPSRLSQVRERRRHVREGLRVAAQISSPVKPIDEPKPVATPRLAFRKTNGMVLPLDTDDDMAFWPTDRPLVSVIVTSFNYGHFVAESVDSVLAQTFTDLEVIVVEGGSTNLNSRQLTLSLDRPRTRIIAQDAPQLVGANRNFGISHARGKYVCCLDADDMLAPTYIEKAVFLLETSDFDVVSCGMRVFGNDTGSIGTLGAPILDDLLENNHMLTCAVFRRNHWRISGGFQDVDPQITGHIHEDWLFWTRLAALGARMHNMGCDYLFLYRRHGASTTDRPDLHPLDVHRALIRQALTDLIEPAGVSPAHHALIKSKRQAQSPHNLARLASPDARRPVRLLALAFTIIGGAEQLLSGIVTYLAAQGWRVLITTSIDPGTEHGDTSGWFESATKEIYHLPRFLPPERWQEFVRYLIASRGVDILWVAGSAFMYDHLPSLRMAFPQMKVADLLFNAVGHTANNRKYAELIDVTFVENQEVLQFLRDSGEAEERIALVLSGVDLQTFQPSVRDPHVAETIGIEPNELIVGFSGRWSEEKDPVTFVEIARRSMHLPIRFVMTGTGAMRHDIEAAIRTAALPDKFFHLIGEVDDVLPWLRSYDILVLPSRLDGRPVVVLEALALGVPVVASRVGALPELIADGVNGFLCTPGDVDAFAESLERLARDRDLLARMKQAARAYAEQHLDAQPMLSGYEERLRLLTQQDERTQIDT
jgi:glycosyltransferase involved in cell wall biosynthesis/SAM-dependent methyltransferase